MGECLSIACNNSRSRALGEGKLPGVILAIPLTYPTGAPLQFGALFRMFEPDRLRYVTGDERQTTFGIFKSFKKFCHCYA